MFIFIYGTYIVNLILTLGFLSKHFRLNFFLIYDFNLTNFVNVDFVLFKI